MTRERFIEQETTIWGYEYIFDLIDRGYLPVNTEHGWKWMIVSNRDFIATSLASDLTSG